MAAKKPRGGAVQQPSHAGRVAKTRRNPQATNGSRFTDAVTTRPLGAAHRSLAGNCESAIDQAIHCRIHTIGFRKRPDVIYDDVSRFSAVMPA